MATSEDDSTRQEPPNQPLDVITDRPSEDTTQDSSSDPHNPHNPPSKDEVDGKPCVDSVDSNDSSLDSCPSESSSSGSSTNDAASDTSGSGVSEDDHDTKTTEPKTSDADIEKKTDTANEQPPDEEPGPDPGRSPSAGEGTSTEDGNLADESIITDAESPGIAQDAAEQGVQEPSDDTDAVLNAKPDQYVSVASQTDHDPKFDPENDNIVEDNNHVEDDNAPTTDQAPDPSRPGDSPDVGNDPGGGNGEAPDRSPEPSEAGDAPEVNNDDAPEVNNESENDNEAENDNAREVDDAPDGDRTPEVTVEPGPPYEDSAITTRLRKMDDTSPSREEWVLRKEKSGKDNEALDGLMLKYGLEEVKAHFLWVYDQAQTTLDQEGTLWDLTNLHACFLEGGKNTRTMVLNLYMKLLQSLSLVEADLVARGSSGDYLGDTWDNATEYGNRGILHVETPECADFKPLKSTLARRFKKSKAEKQPVVVFHIPYPAEEATDYILEPEDQVPSMHAIPVRQTQDQMLATLTAEMKEEIVHKTVEGGWDGPVFQRFIQRATTKGDLRSTDIVSKSADGLAARRIKRRIAENEGRAPKPAGDVYYTKSDLLGATAVELGYQSAAWAELEKMIGMEDVKESVRELLAEAALSRRLELEGKSALGAWSNRRCFIGPPGTGKTTAARLYGQILKELDLLENDTIIEKRASDLVGAYVGWSEHATQKAFKKASGGVLIIDDFHLLFPNTMHNTNGSDVFRAAVIDTIVAEIDPNTTRKQAVILIGYPESMTEAFETSNPGLSRRFPMAQAFRFHNYDDAELKQILHLKLATHNLTLTPTAAQVAEEMLSVARHRPNFGNGGAVETLLQTAQLARNARCATVAVDADLDLTLLPSDFDPDWQRAAEAARRCAALFREMQGMGGVLGQFQGYQAMTARMRARGLDPRPHVPWALVFRGPPGTGKTTVARKMARVYYDMGFLAGAEIVECSVADLISSHVGGSAKRVIRMFERALGKVLFIDEAYRLAEARADDAIGEIVDCMTKERFCGKLVVVLAGYKEEMDDLMRCNRGLRSRFATNVDFKPMKAADALQLLQTHLAKVDIVLGGIARSSRETILDLLTKLSRSRSWANGRDVIALSRTIVQEAYTMGKSHTEKDHKGDQGSKDKAEKQDKVVFHADDLISVLRQKLRNAKDEGDNDN
ncbi:P-loop containing nucleoside triphosphate hydrolase protein [Chaetomium fimeti]|uniref:P-loop containing nucleoside triphosphate hydrolase protein n=1 Tax=Chaetomium fimeti TaxID=1854472 RepID=A0AAE0LPZ5_9PEZI|nr:P-loop containing nucleoside triphosphate hydrolase protein [Chaetomium fimeti]